MRFLSFFLASVLILVSLTRGHAQDGSAIAKGTQTQIDAFIRRMKDWGEYYGDLAGTENLWLAEDDEVKQRGLLIGGGDWAVYDRRLCSGAYGVSHDDASIMPVDLKKPEDYDTSCFTPVITSPVDAITLMRRYQWFSSLFIHWAHVRTPSPFQVEGWDDFEDITESYVAEKPGLANDPHLALYWLMHFGFTLDDRYDEVKQIIEQNDLSQRLDFIQNAIAFFDHQSPDTDIDISSSDEDRAELEEIFLKRRAYLMFTTRSYDHASGAGGLDAWWHSIKLYPKAERKMVLRMRWLGNNLTKYDQWAAFNDLLRTEPAVDEISLLSYVRALNPLEAATDRQQYAEAFLRELIADEQLWKNPLEREFGRNMIWSVREQVQDRSLLKAAVDLYFASDTISKEYEDLNSILNGADANQKLAKIRAAVTALEELNESYNQFEATPDERGAFYDQVDTILDQASQDGVLSEVVTNLRHEPLLQRALRHVYTHDFPGKAELFTALFIRLEPFNHDIPNIFEGQFPKMFTGEDDPNIKLMQQIFYLTDADYRNDYAAKRGRESATMFFLDSAHWPGNFEFFTQLLKNEKLNDLEGLKDSVFTNLLSEEYGTKINPTHRMDQAQLETLLETVSDVLRTPGWHKYLFSQEAIRTIYYMNNPLAKPWLEKHHNNSTWLKTFPNVDMGFDPLPFEVNDAIEAALEGM